MSVCDWICSVFLHQNIISSSCGEIKSPAPTIPIPVSSHHHQTRRNIATAYFRKYISPNSQRRLNSSRKTLLNFSVLDLPGDVVTHLRLLVAMVAMEILRTHPPDTISLVSEKQLNSTGNLLLNFAVLETVGCDRSVACSFRRKGNHSSTWLDPVLEIDAGRRV